MTQRSKKSHDIENKKLEELGRILVSIGESGEVNRKKLYKTAFIKGIFSGLGGVIGATLVLTLLLFILSMIGYIPFVDVIVEKIESSIQNR